MKKFVLPLVFVLLISGCIQTGQQPDSSASAKDMATSKCIQSCQDAKDEDLSAGPCLSNKAAEDWVCDAAHSPRQPVDNSPENQCPEYGKTAGHFVEVDENCGLIRAV